MEMPHTAVFVTSAFIVLILSPGTGSAQSADKNDSGWIVLNSSGYLLSLEPMNWSTAQEYCQEKGTNLASLTSEEELSKITDELRLATSQRTWWLGVRRSSSSSNKWVSLNEDSSFSGQITMWNDGEPNNLDDSEECGMMFPSGLLNDAWCGHAHFYICEKPLRSDENTGDEEKCDYGWILMSSSCFKLSRNKKNWPDAKDICTSNKANLITVNSLEELLQIKKEMHLLASRAIWWVGLRNSSSPNRLWKWPEGPSLLTPKITQWKNDEPNNALGDEDCVMMDNDGLLSDVLCNSSRHYICTKTSKRSEQCADGWSEIARACYKFSIQPMSWSEAQEKCQSEDSNLLTVTSLYDLIKIQRELKWVSTRWWVGQQRNKWKWPDPAAVFSSAITPWDTSVPNQPEGDGDCAEMDYTGLLNDAPCDSLFRYVCKKPPYKATAYKIDRCDMPWKQLDANCYKFSTNKESWLDAQKNCERDASNLLSITSLSEQANVQEWLRKGSKRWWVGLQRIQPGSGTWKWLDSATDFTNHITPWDRNQPDNYEIQEDCAEISPRGRLNDVSCSKHLGFSCEKALPNRDEGCGTDWFLFNHACYKLFTYNTDWSNAQQLCQEGGANLLSLNSVDELKMIRTEIRKVSERLWVALRRTSTDNHTSLDSPTDSLNRVRGESNCVDVTLGGEIRYTNCSNIRPFLCEKQKKWKNITRTAVCGSDWFLISDVCYKLSTKTMPWFHAQESCKVEGGNLMSASTLHDLIEVQKLTNLGSWRWWTGERTTSQKCVAISSSGSVHIEDCDAAHPYICEKRKCSFPGRTH